MFLLLACYQLLLTTTSVLLILILTITIITHTMYHGVRYNDGTQKKAIISFKEQAKLLI